MTPSQSQESSNQHFEHWALIELMGHQRIAGLVCEVNIAGRGFLRVDVPDANGVIQFSRIYAPDAIYCISPTDRQIAIGLAVKCAARPFQCYDLQKLIADKKVDPPQADFGFQSAVEANDDDDDGEIF